MADHKIQLKDKSGNNLFPVVDRRVITDFAHTHAFTGTQKNISVTGSYAKATGVSIGAITPTGTVTLSRSANVALSTTSINQITGVGSLPTKAAVTVVTGVSGGGGSRTLSYLHYTAPTATKGSYTPAGSVSRSASVALSNNTGLCKATMSGTTLMLSSTTVSVSTQPAFTFTGSATTALVTAVSGGSLTANTTSTNGIKVVTDASFSGASATTSTISQITGVGNLPTMSAVTVATGVATQPNFTGTFKGTTVTPTGTITTSTTTLTATGSYTPEGTVGGVQ